MADGTRQLQPYKGWYDTDTSGLTISHLGALTGIHIQDYNDIIYKKENPQEINFNYPSRRDNFTNLKIK